MISWYNVLVEKQEFVTAEITVKPVYNKVVYEYTTELGEE